MLRSSLRCKQWDTNYLGGSCFNGVMSGMCVVCSVWGRGELFQTQLLLPVCMLTVCVCVSSLQTFLQNKENSLYFHYDKPHSFKVGGQPHGEGVDA